MSDPVEREAASRRLVRVGDCILPIEVQMMLGEIYADVCALERQVAELRAAQPNGGDDE